MKNMPEGTDAASLKTLFIENEDVKDVLYKLLANRDNWVMTPDRGVYFNGPAELSSDGTLKPLHTGEKKWESLSTEDQDAFWYECVRTHPGSTIILTHGGKGCDGPVVIALSQDEKHRIVAVAMGEEFRGNVLYVPKDMLRTEE